jgi:hypothetical protein
MRVKRTGGKLGKIEPEGERAGETCRRISAAGKTEDRAGGRECRSDR